MRIGDITTRSFHACGPHDSLNDAAHLMWQHDCGCVPVLEHGRVVGILTDRDICGAARNETRPLREIPIGCVMSSPVHICREEDTVEDVVARMVRHRVRRLVVLDATGVIVGIVALNDIANLALAECVSPAPTLTLEAAGRALAAVSGARVTIPPRIAA